MTVISPPETTFGATRSGLNSAADYARQLAASAEAAGTTVETARNETPTPETFTALTAHTWKRSRRMPPAVGL